MQIHTCAVEGAAKTNHCHSELKKHRTQKKKVQHSYFTNNTKRKEQNSTWGQERDSKQGETK